MPTFIAEVRDNKGNTRQEKISAKSAIVAQKQLKEKYQFVKNVRQQKGLDLSKLTQINVQDIEAAMSPVSVKDRAVFSRQFAAMVNAGVAMVRCLSILGEQSANPRLKKALSQISLEVQQGTNLSDAMRRQPQCFDNLYVSMIQAGEVGGVLDEVLNRLAKVLEDMARLKNQIKGAMAYPVAVGILATLVFLAMTIFLIPIFAKIFKDIGAELPALTQFMLDVSGILTSWMAVIPIAVVAGVGFAFRQYYKTTVGRVTVDRLLLKMPIVGDLNEKSAVARFCRIFGTLTRSGVPILSSLDIVRDTAGNQVIANAIEKAKYEVQQGGMLSLALQRERVFPPLAIQMISIGEETGEIDAMMMKVADFYEDEVEQAVKALTSVLEPIMMVFLAGMVAVILLAMYLPMFKVFEKLA
jgi:type IV pilus assembly protein PilC